MPFAFESLRLTLDQVLNCHEYQEIILLFAVDGKWGGFSAWSKCTKSCGGGTQARSRKCNNPTPAHGGKKCTGVAKQTRACGTKSCAGETGQVDW